MSNTSGNERFVLNCIMILTISVVIIMLAVVGVAGTYIGTVWSDNNAPEPKVEYSCHEESGYFTWRIPGDLEIAPGGNKCGETQ